MAVNNINTNNYKRIFDNFLISNRNYWENIFINDNDTNGYILIDLLVNHPGYINTNLITGKFLASTLNVKPIALFNSNNNTDVFKIINSYCIDDFIDINNIKISLSFKIYYYMKAFYYKNSIRTKNDLLNLKINNLVVGYYIYDTILLRTGYGTIDFDKINIFPFIKETLYKIHTYEQILSNKQIRFFLLSELSYIDGGISSRIAVSKSIIIFSRKFAPTRVSIKKCKYNEDLEVWPGAPDIEMYNFNCRNNKELSIKWAEEYLKRRLVGKLYENDWGAVNAYKLTKLLDKDEIVNIFKIDTSMKIVLILPHVLVDAPHGYRNLLFHDYYDWLIKTLEIASKLENIIWLVKPHPSEKYYNCKDSVAKIVNRYSTYDNIKLVSDTISGISFIDIINAVLTVNGTAALEYSCMGIPAITAGDSPFSGAGFCIEPKSEEEYEKTLMQINKIKPLEIDKIEKAKVFLYTYEYSNKVRIPFIPEHSSNKDVNKIIYYNKHIKNLYNYKIEDINNFKSYIANII